MDSEVTLDYMKTFEHDKMIYEEGRENGIEEGISNGEQSRSNSDKASTRFKQAKQTLPIATPPETC